MAGLPKGNSDPTPGGLTVGYTINESKQAECAISVSRIDTLLKDPEGSIEHKHGRRGPGVPFLNGEEHMGPERLG